MRNSSKGYTIIEVLIASLIFSGMAILATVAIDQSLRQYQAIMQKGLNFWEEAKIQWLQRSLNSAIDYYVRDENYFWFPYFTGKSDYISYVSLCPFSHDSAVLVFLMKERKENGKYRLVYYEIPVYTLNLKDIERIYVFEDYRKGVSFDFFDELETLNFEFYGYDRVRKTYDWFKEYDGKKFLILPQMVKITYAKEGFKDSIYAGINVNNFRKVFYNEFYQK